MTNIHDSLLRFTSFLHYTTFLSELVKCQNQASQIILFTNNSSYKTKSTSKNPLTYIHCPSARYLYQDPRADGRPPAPPFLCPRRCRPVVS